MKILQYGKNPYFTKELEALGHAVYSIGETKSCSLELMSVMTAQQALNVCMSQGFVPDVFLYADDSSLPHLWGIEELPLPCVFYSIDTYCHGWHGYYAYAFDYVLYAQGEEKEKFPCAAEHFPLFATYVTEEESKEEWLKKRDIPIAFVGTLGNKNNPDRNTFYTLFKAFEPIFITKGNFVPVYLRSRIILNQSAVGELNFRTFEAMGLGCACLADNVPTEENHIGKIFQFGVNSLPVYPRGDVAKAVDFSRHWLSKEKENDLYEIAMQGRKLVQEKHSAKARTLRLVKIFQQLLAEQTVQKRLAERTERKKVIAQAFSYLAKQSVLDAQLTAAYADIAKKYETLQQ